VTRDGNAALEARVLLLSMASLLRYLIPALVSDQSNHFSNLQPAARYPCPRHVGTQPV